MQFVSGPSSFSRHSHGGTLSSTERTGRKSYKKMPSGKSRGRDGVKEAVWPPELEEALLEGLRTYRPVSKSGRPLLRFTKRNCFIANYIKEHTGQSRTAKQVGSRLQQITESCKDEEIIRLITNRDLHPPSESRASTELSEINDIPCSSVSCKTLSMSPTPATTPALSASSTISDLDSYEVWPPRYQPEYTDNVALLMSLNVPQPLGLGLDAEICDNTNLILTIDQEQKNDVRRLLIPSHSLFDRAPDLSIASTLLSPGISYTFSFTVYHDGEFIHFENGELIAVKEEYPGGFCTLKTTLLLNDSWQKVIRGTEIERYTIVLDIMDTGLGKRRHLFSVNIILNPTSDAVPTQPSPTAFHANVFEGPPLSHDFSDLRVPVCHSSALQPEFHLQSYSEFQNNAGMSSWNAPSYFVPSATFVPYNSFGDSQFILSQESGLPTSYYFPQM